jgi:ATP-binding cassette, subfamily B, bacterial CvaB/MchF/RaxB
MTTGLLDSLHFGLRRRVPLILQTEAAECGLVCLAMISGFYGRLIALTDLRRRVGVSTKGARLTDLTRIAGQLGLATRPVRIELAELAMLRTPCILHWDLNHFVVLCSTGRRGLLIHDPAVGRVRVSLEEASRRFSGVALEVTEAPGFAAQPAAPRIGLRDVLGRMTGLRRSLLEVLALALAIEVFAVVNPLFLQWVVDSALLSADYGLLTTLALGFGIVLVLQVIVSAMRGWTLMVLSASLKVQGGTNLFSHLLRLPASYFETRHLGDVMSRFGSQETIQRAMTTNLIEAILDGLMSVITVAIMFLFSPSLTALVLVVAALYAGLRWATYGALRQASMETIVWGARRDSHFLETLRAIKTIKLFGAEDNRRAHWLNLVAETTNRDLNARKLQLLFRFVNGALIGGLAIVIVWLGAQRILAGVFSTGMLLAFIAYHTQFMSRVSGLIDMLIDLRMLRLHVERLADVVLTEPERQDPYVSVGRIWPSIEVRDLCFRYGEGEPWVLDHVSLRIDPGECVAIVGPSGCGKTTLAKLIASLLQPTSGELLVGGVPIAHIGIDRYRRMIGVVMQDDKLLAGSIADNISFFAPRPSRKRVERAAQLAAVHEDIVGMPMGYNTLIGDMGAALSGGQQQRVMIARALYRRPRILLLDEATSHLDVALERAVNAAIQGRRFTRIIIAHRPETIRSADRVIELSPT